MNSPFNSKRGSNFALPNLYACLLALLMIQGCATEPKEQTARAPSQPPVEDTATTQPLKMDDQAIPATDLSQARLSPLSREQIQQRFADINALIQAGNFNEAKKQADGLDPSLLSEQENALLNLLYGQISLSMGEAELALDNLQRIQPRLLGSEEKITYLQAKAFAFSLMGNLVASAQSRIELGALLTTAESREQNQHAILDALFLLKDAELESSSLSPTDPLVGWMALAKIHKHKDQPDFNARLNQWRAAYPDHPADPALLTQGPTASNNIHYPGSIAVMLPESGPFAAAGKAIKAGLMAAFDNLNSQDAKPNLQFYDTKQAPLVELYHQAVAAGAEFIIGPLEKSEIQSLADSAVLDIPVLALNHIQNLEQYNLYQFALSPVDDVEQITETARQAGHKKALLLIPENPQTQRIAGYFKENWQNGDTALLKVQTYRPKMTDFSMSIGLLLNRDENSPLYAEVSPFGHEAEQRQEADVIFISAYTEEARAIKQQLNIDGAEDLAVYALPNVYSGQANPARDQILNGVTICDMPWFFNTAYPGNLSMNSLSAVRQQFPGSYLRLIAMGIDAFNLTAHLENLDGQSYPGATGQLSLTKDNRIRRQLICARFTGGQPKIIGNADRSGPALDSNSTAAPAQELAGHDPVN
ncbi:MAG: penicillin-binding protein activator [Methylosarcina sp.]